MQPENHNNSIDLNAVRAEVEQAYNFVVPNMAEKSVKTTELINPVSAQLFEIGQNLEKLRQNNLVINKTNRGNFVANSLNRALKIRQQNLSIDELKQREGEIGGSLFGEVSSGETRYFFNDDILNWYFFDSQKQLTLHYEIYREGVLKVSAQRGEFISDEELDNFVLAVDSYYDKVSQLVYNKPTKKVA